ncbi:NAD(P)-binding protein [Aspergillus japonicus CBS 114.51]|uniref:NAD(P)-binding protein n=2 Tax=Aspergillus TaxID=5052 RepID=A0A2V5HEL7_ASPV1|nr:NAD(P)-binding protein [Aspergillus japonicus CBS 114.51]PYI20254.1 NAD(P)-binding protein [Aspergillus violaceofuscus CBS 115571]RAH76912.1 NAD(P)-binding protein [Aspergillus japonicus CBS 114.51]
MSAKLQAQASKEAAFSAFFKRQLFHSIPTVSTDLRGQVAIVTGANVGLGLACARQLLALQLSRLILAVRSPPKGEAAARELRAAFPAAHVEVWPLDLASYASIQAFVSRCRTELGRVDIAILNAGLALKRYQPTTSNPGPARETTLQVNFLSTALLALLLLPSLRRSQAESDKPGAGTALASSPGRLTLVGSDTAYWLDAAGLLRGQPSLLAAANSPKAFDGLQRYKLTKLFVLMFVAKLARDVVAADEVLVNVACPGLCKGTAFVREPDDNRAKQAVVSGLIRLMGRTPELGARVYLDAALAQGPQSHGSMLSEGRILPFPPIMYKEPDLMDRLWNEIMEEFETAGMGRELAEVVGPSRVSKA